MNILFEKQPVIVPMKYVVFIPTVIDNFKEEGNKIISLFKKKLKGQISRLRNKDYNRLVEKLEESFGIDKDSWDMATSTPNLDDQVKFMGLGGIRKVSSDPRINRFKSSRLEPRSSFKETLISNDTEFLKIISENQKIAKQSSMQSAKDDVKILEDELEDPNHVLNKSIEIETLGQEDSDESSQSRETIKSKRKEIKDPKDVCVADAESLSIKDYLKAFAKSKCSPIMIAPGIFSTKLVVEINCENMRQQNPELFRTCGWTHCEEKLLARVPKKEYILWVPDILNDLNLLSMNQEKNNCWVQLFSMPLNSEAVKAKDYPNVFKDTWEMGWRVRLFGNTEGSDAQHKCGSSAIEYLLPYNISADNLGGTRETLNALRLMGYRDGLSMQAMPYDFRKASGLNFGFKRSFKESLIRMKKLTGKKTIVLAHSFGTVNTYSAILDLTEEEKRELVDFWAPVGGPLMGDVELMATMVTGENPLSILNGLIGLTKQQALKTFYETTFSFELLPYNYWKFVDQKWFQEFVLGRVISETKSEVLEMSRPSFFPSPINECYKKLQGSLVNCIFLKSIFPGKKLVNFKHHGYALEEMEEFLEELDYSYPDNEDISLHDVYELSLGNYKEYPHPNVPIVGFFFNTKPTRAQIFFDDEKFDFNQNKKKYKYLFNSGDATVETYSAVVPMLKWAHDFTYSGVGAEYPVKFVDICSEMKRKFHPFDSESYADLFQVNSYIGKGRGRDR